MSCTSDGLSRSSSFFFFFFFLSFGFLSVFCSSNVSIDKGIFGFSIEASKLDLGEFTESNGHVCDDAISGLGDNGLLFWGVYKIWHCQSWPRYTMVYEYSKQIYLLTNISLWKKSITVQKSLMNAIKNIYIFKTELTTLIEIIIGSTSKTVFSPKNDGIK